MFYKQTNTWLLLNADRHHERRHLSRQLPLLQQSYRQLSETAATLRRRKNVSRIRRLRNSVRPIVLHPETMCVSIMTVICCFHAQCRLEKLSSIEDRGQTDRVTALRRGPILAER